MLEKLGSCKKIESVCKYRAATLHPLSCIRVTTERHAWWASDGEETSAERLF